MNNYFSKIIIGLLLIICAWYGKNLDSWGRNKIINHDVIYYYAYLPAAIIFHDFNFQFARNLPADSEIRVWYSTAENGKPVLRMTMGLAILWLPFFLPAHVLAHSLGVSALGYSWPYNLSIFIAAIFYLLIGLVFLRKILLNYFTDWITALTLVIVVAATNLMYYVISEPGMSHVYSFSLITVFLYTTIRWIGKPSWSLSIILGILAGFIVLIRPINVLVLLLPALIGVNSLAGLKTRIADNWKFIVIAALSASLVVLPQLIYWKIQTGYFIFNSYMESSRFYFLHPNITNGLFGFRKGWLIYTPVMFFALFGFFVIRKYAEGLRNALLVFMVLFIYFIFSWWCWWYGGSFGSRPMIDTYGILALPMAAAFSFLFRKKLWIQAFSGILLAALLFLNQFQMGQYRTSLLHWDSMTKEAYLGIFLKKNPPEGYDKMIQKPDEEKALRGEKEKY
jgi:hypothetical protein